MTSARSVFLAIAGIFWLGQVHSQEDINSGCSDVFVEFDFFTLAALLDVRSVAVLDLESVRKSGRYEDYLRLREKGLAEIREIANDQGSWVIVKATPEGEAVLDQLREARKNPRGAVACQRCDSDFSGTRPEEEMPGPAAESRVANPKM